MPFRRFSFQQGSILQYDHSSASHREHSQRTAQHSTGPKTREGKAIAARNNFRHGCTGEFTVLPWEKQAEFDLLIGALRDEHKPSGLTEKILIDKMAQALWLTKRAVMLQHVTFNHEVPTCDDEKQLALYIRYQTTNERIFQKCLSEFLKLRAEKRKAEIGFESQQQKQANQARREAAENRKQELHKWRVLLAQAEVDNQELQNMRLETPEHRIQGRIERIIAAENAA
jgi:hypothetical protein